MKNQQWQWAALVGAIMIVTVFLPGYRPLRAETDSHGVQGKSHSRPAAFPVKVINYDASGKPVAYIYRKAPSRVVITHPGATEILLELGLEGRIVSSVATYDAPLERLANKYARLNIMKAKFLPTREEMLAMGPDLIIGWAHHFNGNELGDVRVWQQRGIATYIMPSSLQRENPTLENTIYSCIADLGQIFGISEQTSGYIQDLKDRVAGIFQRVKDVPRKKTVIVLQYHGNGRFSVYGRNYLISNLVKLAGAENLEHGRISFAGAEQILAFDPDFIIYVPLKQRVRDLSDSEAVAQLKGIKELRSIRAIRRGAIVNLPFFTVNNGGIRAVDTVEYLARKFYPERFGAKTIQ